MKGRSRSANDTSNLKMMPSGKRFFFSKKLFCLKEIALNVLNKHKATSNKREWRHWYRILKFNHSNIELMPPGSDAYMYIVLAEAVATKKARARFFQESVLDIMAYADCHT